MAWKGKFFGALIGLFLTRQIWGAVVGALIGHLFDEAARGDYAPGPAPASVSEAFFRTTFELMGHVAKSDGHVSEREIGAARGLMQDLRLGPNEIQAAIACFRTGKSAGYDADAGVERFRAVCAERHDLLRAFIELQLRAALAGNDLSLPARAILTRAAARLGIPGIEFAYMEAALRARHQARGSAPGGRPDADKPLASSYAELEIAATASDQEVVKAYRRQMRPTRPRRPHRRRHPRRRVRCGNSWRRRRRPYWSPP